MTIVVAFLCTDGVVIGADSMLTASMGSMGLAHHKGKKVHILPANQIFAYSGDQGLGHRFLALAESSAGQIAGIQQPLNYGLALTQAALQNFGATQVGNFALSTVLAFPFCNAPQCCVFEGDKIQPRMLDQHHFYAALGSGKLAADPFLRFLYEVFCQGQQPSIREAKFLTTWALHYTIETVPGGVSDPLYIGVLEADAGGQLTAHELSREDIKEHEDAIQDARQSLRDWRDSLHAQVADDHVPEKPEPPRA